MDNFVLFFNSLDKWMLALIVFFATVLGFYVLRFYVGRRVEQIAKNTKTKVDDAVIYTLQQTKLLFVIVLGLFVSIRVLAVTEQVYLVVRTVTLVMLFIQMGFWATGLLNYVIQMRKRIEMENQDGSSATTLGALSLVGKVIIWTVASLLALDNIPNVEVNSLIASLGITGIAVALAVQNILGDLFASLSIALDKPFVLGDYIAVGDLGGTVEKIGLKSSHLRALSGEQLVFGNSDLLGSRIKNYGRMERRRKVFSLGVTYQTKPEQLATVPTIVKEIVEATDPAEFDRCHMTELGAFSINFEVVYYMPIPDYALFMDTNQKIQMAIFEKFSAAGIEFAYPTQTLFMEKSE
jgi:small-conductance mechanosensitive channel